MPSMAPGDALMRIRTVAELTGVNPVTLRAWERRYQLITPQRTPKGHRLYSPHNLALIHQILSLLDQGVAISQVKPLLSKTPNEGSMTLQSDSNQERIESHWQSYRQQIFDVLKNFDETALDDIYDDALSIYSAEVVSRRLTVPVLRSLGANWKESATGIAQEHFFSVYLRNKLGARIRYINQRTNGPMLLFACLPGEFHEIGLLYFALACGDAGYRTLVLGANTPLEQIPGVLKTQKVVGVVLSCSSRFSRGVLENDLPALVDAVNVPVFVGGKTSLSHASKIAATKAIMLSETMSASVEVINQVLQ